MIGLCYYFLFNLSKDGFLLSILETLRHMLSVYVLNTYGEVLIRNGVSPWQEKQFLSPNY